MKNRNVWNATGSFVAAAGFIFLGILAFTFHASFYLWFIPLNFVTFIIIGAIFLIIAIYGLVSAPEKDRAEKQAFNDEVAGAQQSAAASQPLDAPCTVNIAHTEGHLAPLASVTVIFNGQEVGKLKSKQTMSLTTTTTENTVLVIFSANQAKDSITFSAAPGGAVSIGIILPSLGKTMGGEQAIKLAI